MDEKMLLRIALLGGCMGLCILLFLVMTQDNHTNNYVLATEGDQVTIKGKVIRSSGNYITMIIQEPVTVTVFGNNTAARGDDLVIYGRIEEYKGKKQLIADRITKG